MFARGGRSTGRHARGDRSRRGQSRQRRSLAEEVGAAEELAAAGGDHAEPAAPGGSGPYDSADAPPGVDRIDLGSLKLPSVAGVEVRVQANQQGVVQQVYLVCGESVLQLGAFAAPRSEPLWDEVRAEIRQQLFADGVAAEETAGEYGVELRARVRTPQGLKDLRFVGIDGPRWMVRAVYQGPAATDPASAAPLTECLRGLVVERDEQARPVKEPLPLALSTELAEQIASRVGGAGGPAGAAGPAAPAGNLHPAGPATGGVNGVDPAGGNGAPRRRPSPRPRRD